MDIARELKFNMPYFHEIFYRWTFFLPLYSSYTAPDGTPIQLSFTAGDDGYQPSGDHLPQPVPLPYNRNDYNDH